MFEIIYTCPYYIARHEAAPFASERLRYLEYCRQRGDSRAVVYTKSSDLLWLARRIDIEYASLNITVEQIRALLRVCRERGNVGLHNLSCPKTLKRLIYVAHGWLRYLGSSREPVEVVPFQLRLDEYCDWSRQEVGLSEATIYSYRSRIKQFLQWYGISGKPLSDVQITDIDAYITHGSQRNWKARVTIRNVVEALRAFFNYGSRQKWCDPRLPESIDKPRLYSFENLPAGPTWVEVRRLFASLDPTRATDIRDRAILMLLTVYGLRSSEVANLCLDDIDWEHDQLCVSRAKRRGAQAYPLIPSVGNALVEYLRTVRYSSSPHRNVFLTLLSPYAPLSKGGMHHVVAVRLRSLNVRTLHQGPHSLRHACASRLLSEGLSLKEIGDHLGHRSPSATRTYAKVDLVGLRKVAEFDLGELSCN